MSNRGYRAWTESWTAAYAAADGAPEEDRRAYADHAAERSLAVDDEVSGLLALAAWHGAVAQHLRQCAAIVQGDGP